MTLAIALYGLLALVGLILSALFSGSETGLYTINRVRLAVRSNRGDVRAKRLRWLIDRPGVMLTTILIGNNIANYFGSYGLAAILDTFELTTVALIVINVVILTPLLFVFGEILPKDLFRTHTDSWSYGVSGFLMFAKNLFYYTGMTPIVQVVGALVSGMSGERSGTPVTGRQRMSQLMQEGIGAGVLTEAQTTLVDRSLTLRKKTVEEEMVPWVRVVTLSVDATREQREHIMRRRNFSRLPLIDRSGNPIGVLRLLDAVLEPEATTRELMGPIATFSPETPIREALRTMRHGQYAMAVIVNPRTNRKLGIVTIKDLVEPLTGELAVW
jgi:CBS domain containing-hemolysin-like protein